ncbi:LLM class flavin-dependent oxidoreductase [Tersicoccus sp. MR15.9]|uniref:LLM class flavin-dependent oxidoreductase n=1 Tax=Tersicoccus mangrovi TaxID=3121635 RepID=UPI002FE6A617
MTAPRQLAFLSFVPDDGGDAGEALRRGMRQFRDAEQLGYDSGWVRVRHFEPFLSSPLTFLTAVAQATERMHLGTGVLPMRYEDPIRTAEDAATLDLISGGRLELGVSGGIAPLAGVLDEVFGTTHRGFDGETQERIHRLRAALAGQPVAHATGPFSTLPAGSDLRVTPHAPGLADRVWYGPGSVRSARRAGEQGMDLQLSTLNSEDTGGTFEEGQADQIRAYRQGRSAASAAAGGRLREPRVAVGRIVLPLLTDADRQAHRGFLDFYNNRMDERGRPRQGGAPIQFGRIHAGSVDEIVDGLARDPALAEATTVSITLPAPGGEAAHARVLETVATSIAPQLGWSAAA